MATRPAQTFPDPPRSCCPVLLPGRVPRASRSPPMPHRGARPQCGDTRSRRTGWSRDGPGVGNALDEKASQPRCCDGRGQNCPACRPLPPARATADTTFAGTIFSRHNRGVFRSCAAWLRMTGAKQSWFLFPQGGTSRSARNGKTMDRPAMRPRGAADEPSQNRTLLPLNDVSGGGMSGHSGHSRQNSSCQSRLAQDAETVPLNRPIERRALLIPGGKGVSKPRLSNLPSEKMRASACRTAPDCFSRTAAEIPARQ